MTNIELTTDSESEAKPSDNVSKSREALMEDADSRPRILYTVEQNPPWYTCLVLGLQHFMMMVESTVSIPYFLSPLMCIADHDPARSQMVSTILFVSGLVTLFQTTFGVRLPIVQGGTHGFLGPIIAILALMPCPSDEEMAKLSSEERQNIWQERMRHVQGAICVAALFQMFVGFTGLVGILIKYITPLVITPTVSLIGLSLFKIANEKAVSNWAISGLTVFLLLLFSQYLGNVKVPWCSITSQRKLKKSHIFIFKLFPVILALVISWGVCLILTLTGTLDAKNHARTDLRVNMIYEASWFVLPYPGQWGVPVVTVAGVLGILAGVIASIIESIGDYYACARLAAAPPPPTHAINRGIFSEGLGTFMAGLFGTGSGTTSYSQNVGAIGVTGVGSRRVVQYAAGIMIVCGLVGKVGAFFINIPEPIIGGIFIVVFSMITSVGLSSLQFVDLNSARNLFVLGFSIFFGLSIPLWMQSPENENVIQTSIPVLDQILSVLLRTSMFVGGFLGFVLDNTIPGTRKERGLIAWENELKGGAASSEDEPIQGQKISQSECYDMPIGSSWIKKCKILRYLPISPTFQGWGNIRNRKVSPIPHENRTA